MGFDDVARRMKERHGENGLGGPPPELPDPGHEMADAERELRRSRASGEIVVGIMLIVIGVVITAATYSSVSTTGGSYIVAYGPIIVGVIKLFRGLAWSAS